MSRSAIRRMVPRSPHEVGRSATPLELLFDLCFVVAVAQAASSLHHSILEGHGAEGALGFLLVFFAIWWAWMGFTWFASAFDTDDAPYRLKVLVQMVGVLVLAAGVPRAFEHGDFGLITYGYTILRAGQVAHWLRAARSDPALRRAALRYAIGLACIQVAWLSLLALPDDLWIYGWFVLVPVELWIPWWAENACPTPWHPHHIAERYGLFTIIVIGESVLAGTVAIQSAIDLSHAPLALVETIVATPVILFAMWWIYFARPGHIHLTSLRTAFFWGYGHYFIFASAAAVGAALAVLVDHVAETSGHGAGHGHLSDVVAGMALAVSVVVFLVTVWFIHLRRCVARPFEKLAVPVGSLLVLATPWTGHTALAVATILAILTWIVVRGLRTEEAAATTAFGEHGS